VRSGASGATQTRTENCRETTDLGLGPGRVRQPPWLVWNQGMGWPAWGTEANAVLAERKRSCGVVARCIDGRTVDALAPAAEEGRSHAAKRAGEGLAPGNPAISEWGNPAAVMGRHPPVSCGCGGHRGN
jgi:hypothetical protein